MPKRSSSDDSSHRMTNQIDDDLVLVLTFDETIKIRFNLISQFSSHKFNVSRGISLIAWGSQEHGNW